MFFSCGVSVGLFFYGVAEPIYHYVGPNRYTADYTMPDNTLAQVCGQLFNVFSFDEFVLFYGY